MAVTKETKVIISADASKYTRAMRSMKLRTTKTTASVQRSFMKIKSSMLGILGAAAAVAGVGGFALIAKSAISAASDLEEVGSKFSVVFKGMEKAAEKWSETLVDTYGLSTREAKEYLSSVQDLLVPMGMQARAAGVLSNEIVKLSVDLGSFNNMPTAKVMEDIQSALVGNFETMKKYGVVLNVATTTQKALEMGLAATKDELTAGMKAQAAYQLMVEGSKAAIGDWARTSESFANQMKQLTSNIEDLRAEIGKELLPLITPIIKSMNEWAKANKGLIGTEFKEWLDAVNPVFKVFAATASILAQAAGGIGMVIGALGDITPFPEELKGDFRLGRTPTGGAPSPIGGDETTADTEKKAAELERLQLHHQTIEQLRMNHGFNLAAIARQDAETRAQITATSAKNEATVAKSMHQLEKNMAMAKLNLAVAVGTAGLAIAGTDAKKMFVIQKTVQIGMAIMAAFLASNLALATFPGPPYTIPLAAATLKLGLFNAGVVAATSIGQLATSGGGGGGGLAGGGTFISPTVTTPTVAPVGTSALLAETAEKRGTLNFFFEGDIIGDDQFIDDMVERINAAEDRDVFINKTVFATELE